MRLLIDTLIALLIAGVLGSIVWYHKSQSEESEQVTAVQEALRAIHGQCMYRAAVGEVQQTPVGFALHLSADWFDPLPANLLVRRSMPTCYWLEEASDEHRTRFDPPQIVADELLPSFWYNPHRGAIRARVPAQLSQQQTVELYNLVNGTSLKVEDVTWNSRDALARGLVIDKRPVPRHAIAVRQSPADAVLRDLGRR